MIRPTRPARSPVRTSGTTNNEGPNHDQQGRERCAHSLADAESWAEDAGVEYIWDGDSDGMYCVARFGDRLESVGGIDSTDNGYGRVIEAESAREIPGRVRAETAGWAIR